MKYISILLVVILSSCSKEKKLECNYITDYYQKIYKADYEFLTENFDKAFTLYQEAFNSCEPISTATYNELSKFAETCAILGKNDLAIEFITMRIKRGYEIEWMLENPNYNKVFASKKGIKLISNYQALRKEGLSHLNLNLREEIIRMKFEDQKYRSESGAGEGQEEIDTYNTKRLIEIFEEFGYPNETIIGGFIIDRTPVDINSILLHTSDSIRMNYFVPKLTEFVEKGMCSPHVLATVIDQYHLYNGDPQIYGTYTKQGRGYANMITDLKEVDNNRISIGLSPLRLKEKKDSIVKLRYMN